MKRFCDTDVDDKVSQSDTAKRRVVVASAAAAVTAAAVVASSAGRRPEAASCAATLTPLTRENCAKFRAVCDVVLPVRFPPRLWQTLTERSSDACFLGTCACVHVCVFVCTSQQHTETSMFLQRRSATKLWVVFARNNSRHRRESRQRQRLQRRHRVGKCLDWRSMRRIATQASVRRCCVALKLGSSTVQRQRRQRRFYKCTYKRPTRMRDAFTSAMDSFSQRRCTVTRRVCFFFVSCD